MLRPSLTLAAVLFLALPAAAQTPPPPRPPQAAPAVTIVLQTGEINTSEAQIVNEMARSLSQGASFRILPLIGQGSVQSVSDLMTMKSIDAAVVQYDVLSQFRKTQRIPLIENKLQYVTKLFSQEIHVLARMQHMCLADLNGRRVNFGMKGSGAAITSELLFSANQVNVQPVFLDQQEAFDKLKSGEIDAVVYVGGKPSPAFGELKYTDRIHFLDVDYIDALQQDYLPGIMTHDDYPDLIAPNETVSTAAVSSVLIMPGHRSVSEQYRKMSVFTDKFFGNFEALKAKPNHAKWQEVNIFAPLPGWTRFPPAQTWLDANQPKAAKPAPDAAPAAAVAAPQAKPQSEQDPETVRTMLKQFLESQGAGAQGGREELFDQFVRWYEKQNQ